MLFQRAAFDSTELSHERVVKFFLFRAPPTYSQNTGLYQKL